MYKVGGKVICINAHRRYGHDFSYGDNFTIMKIFEDCIKVYDNIPIDNYIGSSYVFELDDENFVTLSRFRKMKLDKLNSTSLISSED